MKFDCSLFCLFSLSIGLLLSSCGKIEQSSNTTIPSCLNSKLINWEVHFGCKSGNSLNQYSIKGKTFFVLEPGNCGADMAALVIDTNCNEIGYLGGIGGNNLKTIYGEEMANSFFVKTIWSN